MKNRKSTERRKGGPVLLEAFRKLREKRPELRLVLAGPSERLDLPDGVVNLGVVPLQRVRELLSEATVFALPTLREPFGIAFLDAMVCGVPCVGTTVGAVPDILGEAGLLVPPADVDALAEAIGSLLDDPARREALASAGRRRVIENDFLWAPVARRLAAVLQTAAAGMALSGAAAPT